jgi:hypothetical protein
MMTKMLGLAGVAFAPKAGGGAPRGRSAIGAKAVARVPMAHRLGRAEPRHRLRVEEPGGGDGAHVDEFEVLAAGDEKHAPVEEAVAMVLALLHRRVGQPRGEQRRAVVAQAQQDFLRQRPQPLGERGREQGLARLARQDRHVAGDQKEAGVGPGAQRRDELQVVSLGRQTVERAARERESGWRSCLEKGVFHRSTALRLASPPPSDYTFGPHSATGEKQWRFA